MSKFDWVRMHPLWYASAAGLACLLSAWGWWSFFEPKRGEELMVFYILSLFIWPLAFALVGGCLVFALHRIDHGIARACIVLGAWAAYFAAHGRPSVWLLGLAVPVTASYIIAAVMVAPALVQSGVPDVAAHMFIFYYAVLSEVSPPTALSPFAAAALTGGNPFQTMMLTWKYTLPAFLVPFVFTLSPEGLGVLLQAPLRDTLVTTVTAAIGVGALAAGFGGWVRGPASVAERAFLVAGGLLLFFASPWTDLAGLALTSVVLFLHFRGHPPAPAAE